MFDITERQQLILEKVVEEYIKRAWPVSSELLKEAGSLAIAPATIRLELAELSRKGFLEKPHISGGRVPTDKGYRFFVNKVLAEEKKAKPNRKAEKEFHRFFQEIDDIFELSHQLAEGLAEFSSGLAVAQLANDFFIEEGWQELASMPEFNNIDYFKHFLQMVKEFEENIGKINFEPEEKVKVLIGSEAPLRQKDFSLIIGRLYFDREPVLAILGPKRMDFRTNIGLINSLMEALEKF